MSDKQDKSVQDIKQDLLQIVESRLQSNIELQKSIEKELNDAKQYINQKTIELNSVIGAIVELETLLKLNK